MRRARESGKIPNECILPCIANYNFLLSLLEEKYEFASAMMPIVNEVDPPDPGMATTSLLSSRLHESRHPGKEAHFISRGHDPLSRPPWCMYYHRSPSEPPPTRA